MEQYYKFRFLIHSDQGDFFLSFVSYSKKSAIECIIKSQNCPKSAIEYISKEKLTRL